MKWSSILGFVSDQLELSTGALQEVDGHWNEESATRYVV